MEVWQIVLASMVTGMIYYGIGCVIANKTCTILREDIDLIVVALFWPIVLIGKILVLPFKLLE